MNKNVPKTNLQSIAVSREPAKEYERRFLVATPGTYILIVIAALLVAWPYSFREHSIFVCQAPDHGSDEYMADCETTTYGDYDYGAFWFGLEPKATDAAADAQVIFLGNSRMQFGFSTKATADWFSSLPANYYLLGFAYNVNYNFEGALLRKLRPKAMAYVINLDLFFEQADSPPAKVVMQDGEARSRYELKRRWQGIQEAVCASHRSICGNERAFVRSRATGAWRLTGGHFTSQPVRYDESVDHSMVDAYISAANQLLSSLPVRRDCVILTLVPTADHSADRRFWGTPGATSIGTAKAIAGGLGKNLIAPELTGLATFDGSHLDPQSAERWSVAFTEAAGPPIRQCLAESAHNRNQGPLSLTSSDDELAAYKSELSR
jgi:hypothetical protein